MLGTPSPDPLFFFFSPKILEFSKLSSEQASEGGAAAVALSSDPFSVAAVAEDLVDIVGGKAALAGVELIVTVSPAVYSGWFLGDCYRIRQILINLVRAGLRARGKRGQQRAATRHCLRTGSGQRAAGMCGLPPWPKPHCARGCLAGGQRGQGVHRGEERPRGCGDRPRAARAPGHP